MDYSTLPSFNIQRQRSKRRINYFFCEIVESSYQIVVVLFQNLRLFFCLFPVRLSRPTRPTTRLHPFPELGKRESSKSTSEVPSRAETKREEDCRTKTQRKEKKCQPLLKKAMFYSRGSRSPIPELHSTTRICSGASRRGRMIRTSTWRGLEIDTRLVLIHLELPPSTPSI